MQYFHFNFDDKFHCKNSGCKHTCCALWDISVDKKTVKRYGVNEYFMNGIDGKTSCYKKDRNGRCTFLDDDNLCKIIKNYGEKYISETCRIHPRFKNFFSDRTETGLGLCCEEVVRLLLSEKDVYFIKTGEKGKNKENTDFENQVLIYRRTLIDKITKSDKPLLSLIEEIAFAIGYREESIADTADALYSLERLCKDFEEDIACIVTGEKIITEYDDKLKKVLIYFILRHVSSAFDTTDMYVKTAFALFSLRALIFMISGRKQKYGKCEIQDLFEIIRKYSSETEYSENNLLSLYERAEERLNFIKIKTFDVQKL